MFKVKHSTLVFLSGLIWLAIGCFLLPLGLNFVVESVLQENHSLPHPVLRFLAPYAGGLEPAILVWIACGLLIGFFKGRYVFAKTVQRSVDRILSLPNPVSISKIYTPKYYLLLSSMVLLGVLVRFAPLDIRGGIDIMIGAALINGAMLYFRQAWAIHQYVSPKLYK